MPAQKKASKIISIPTFMIGDRVIQFWPVKNVPGWTHRVTINGQACDWLSGAFKPNRKTAAFYSEKHS